MSQPVVVVRVKRRRTEEPTETIALNIPRKQFRLATSEVSLSEKIAAVSVTEAQTQQPTDDTSATSASRERLVFRRLQVQHNPTTTSGISSRMLQRIRDCLRKDPTDRSQKRQQDYKSRLERSRQAAFEAVRRKGAQMTYGQTAPSTAEPTADAAATTVRFFDLHASQGRARVTRRIHLSQSEESIAVRASFVPLTRAVPSRILKPLERKMDEAVWRCFRDEDSSEACQPVVAAVQEGADVNYQRVASDLTTALHALCYRGHVPGVVTLLRMGALARVQDAEGKTALDWAQKGGNTALEGLIKDVLHSEAEEIAHYYGTPVPATTDTSSSGASDAQVAGGQDEVYDTYVLDMDIGSAEESSGSAIPATSYTLDAEEASVLYRAVGGAGGEGGLAGTLTGEEDALAALLDWALPTEDDEGDDKYGEDDQDSNDEDAPGNDYPDEDDGFGADDEEEGEEGERAGSDSGSWTYYGGTKGVKRKDLVEEEGEAYDKHDEQVDDVD